MMLEDPDELEAQLNALSVMQDKPLIKSPSIGDMTSRIEARKKMTLLPELPIDREAPSEPTVATQPVTKTEVPPQPSDKPDFGYFDSTGSDENANLSPGLNDSEMESAVSSKMSRTPLRMPEDQPMNQLQKSTLGQIQPSPMMSPSPGRIPSQNNDEGGGNVLFALARGLTAFGGGDVGALDRMRQEQRNAPFRAKKDEAELAQMNENLAGKKLSNSKAAEMINPNSAYSKQRQKEHAALMSATAAVLKNIPQFHSLASLYESEATGAEGKTAAHLDASAERLGKALGQNRQVIDTMAREELAKQMAGQRERGVTAQEKLAENTISNTTNDNSMGWSQLREQERHNKEMERVGGLKAGRLGVRFTGDQQKVVGELANDVNQMRIVDQLLPIAEKYSKESNIPGLGKSGLISGRIQKAKSMLNESSDSEYNKFRGTVQRLFSVERKYFAGVAVTDREMQNLAPMIPDFNVDSEKTIRDKLQSIREFLDTRTSTNMSRLRFDADGNPVDESLLTQMLSQSAPREAANNPILRQKAGGIPPPGTTPARAMETKVLDPELVKRAKKEAAAGDVRAA